MAANHLFVNFADDVGDVEAAFFVGNLRMEEYLEEKIAKFFGEFGVIGGFEGIQDFVGFFDEVGAESRVGLFAIPWAAAGSAETGHKNDEFLEGEAGTRRIRKFGFARSAGSALGFAVGVAGHLVSDAAPRLMKRR
jgi:hypothetical protein